MKYWNRVFVLIVIVANIFICCVRRIPKKEPRLSNMIKDTEFQTIRVDSLKDRLIIYYPQTAHFGLVCGEIPDTSISNISFVCAAAYTGRRLDVFQHDNIAGDHVSAGQRFHGYRCNRNSGAFVSYNSKWKFLYQNYSYELDSAANNNGMGFAQEMMIHDSCIVEHARPDDEMNQYRALCNINGELAIVDSKVSMTFGHFIGLLLNVGAIDALYMDMGGWKQSWYREYEGGEPTVIHPIDNDFGTNWFTVYIVN